MNSQAERIIIIGASGHGKVVANILLRQHRVVVGFIDAAKPIGSLVLSYPVIGREEELPVLIRQHQITAAIVAIGDNWIRGKVQIRILALDLPIISAIDPSAIIGANTRIGNGAVICPGCIIGPDCFIGNGCLLNTKASLDHDCRMDDFSSLAPGVTTGGTVIIGIYSAICLSASISHRIIIGKHVVVGASSLIRHDIPDYSVVYGIPAKVIRSRKEDERYL